MRWATPQQIISNTLFDQGYRRWAADVHTSDAVYQAIVWARRAEDIEDYYIGHGALLVEVSALPLARFNASLAGEKQTMTKHGWDTVRQYSGDIILSDEFLAAQQESERIHGKHSA